jgi:TolB-like protein/Flp pilus assembly protein TadD
MSFFAELKRRNVFRVGAAYLVVAWLLMQVTDTVVPALHLPGWIVTAVVLFLIIGLPLALIFAWAFELTAEGLKREAEVEPAESISHRTGRKLDYLIIGTLVLALGYFAYDKVLLDPQRDAALVERTTQAFEKQAATAADAQKSIAVLPFANMSADPEQEYFVDGLAEELLNLLAGIPELRVAARTSSFSFKNENVDIRAIAEKLNVEHILEGSVRKAGDTLRITAQLIEADSGYHLWSRRFDRQIEDVFAIQEEIAAAVVDALKISLLGDVAKVEEINPEAYTLYLQGKHFYGRRTREGFAKAVEAYQGALKLEPRYALAWSALGQTYFDQATNAHLDTHEGMALARAAIERALELDDGLARPHTAMGWLLLYYDWDWVGADEAMQRALALEPGNTASIEGAAVFAAVLGRLDEAVNLQRRVVAGDPLNQAAHANLGFFLTAVGQLEEAAVVFRHVLELDPQYPGAYFSLGLIFLLQDQPEMALAEIEQETDRTQRDLGTVLVLSALGQAAEADQALAIAIEEHKESATYLNVMVYAWVDNSDKAFRWMDVAYEQRDSFLAEILSNPLLARLKSDPRWPAFLDKMGLPH